jgi:SAM-dependent methyltransferase
VVSLILHEAARAQAAPDYLERAAREAKAIGQAWTKYVDAKTFPTMASVLDIGCGLAAVDALLWYNIPVESIALLDGDAVGRKDSFTNGVKAWNDVAIGAEVVNQNTTIRARTLHPDAKKFPESNLILSLRSWCHHYPASVYLDRVLRALVPHGLLVVDCRAGLDHLDQLQAAGLHYLDTLEESPKRARHVLQRGGT